MRISKEEKTIITSTIHSYIQGNATLYLYGSRVDPTKAGGDIDLALVVESSDQREEIVDQKPSLLTEIKEGIGDQRIDLTVVTEDQFQSDPFLRIISKEFVTLASWKENRQTD